MGRQPASSEIQIDDGTVRVTRWTFAPGSETGHHRHGFDYVVVPVTEGPLTIETADGSTTAELAIGVSYNRAAGVEHNVVNATDHQIVFVEIELLGHAG